MPGPPPAVAAVRVAVRRGLTGAGLAEESAWDPAAEPGPDAPLVAVACSGGADSLALAAGVGFVAPRLGVRAVALVVDHGLQEGSGEVARVAAAQARELVGAAEVLTAQVDPAGAGPEAAARGARYAVLLARADELGAVGLLVGHTLDDQAEQVLLGLARGSGARSLAGMRPARSAEANASGREDHGLELLRPLLGLRRSVTEQACAELGLVPWTDPHNADRRYARVRARQALGRLGEELGPGLPEALARTADLLREDADALDDWADTAYRDRGRWEEGRWTAQVGDVAELPRAVRTRVWRTAALALGSPGTDLTAEHLGAVDELVTHWRGQGPLHLPGGVRAGRGGDRVWLSGAIPSTMATAST
ncbi:tRNA lysidine(34) synthetase TilS [Ornithinimicrobium sp. Y1694]|uniref:tRNA lysidine(34) synthetase TilS n=1 Tax=Ornithinimicrobium sp. Y1694 TaxID=3418590 RepID=UPI003CF48939